ncbi:MAG: precorrin-6A/cobalt-precorrin-6A reductase [Pseudomonadota bacterium]
MKRILILAGTAEARDLASALMKIPGLSPIASLAGATTSPKESACPVRTGGFGGVDGMMSWFHHNRPTAVINATHPFATQIQDNAYTACQETGTPYVRLLRPAWPVDPPRFRMPDLAAAACHLPPRAVVLLTTGKKDLTPFIARKDVAFVLRTIEPVEDLPDHIIPMTATPPFTIESEIELLRRLGATHVIAKNSGGDGDAKLRAAEVLRLVAMVIDRPPRPPGPLVENTEETVAWLHQTVAMSR